MKIIISNQEARHINNALHVIDPSASVSLCSMDKDTRDWDILKFTEDTQGVTIDVNEKFIADALVAMAPQCSMILSMLKALMNALTAMGSGMEALVAQYKKPKKDQQ